MSNKLRIAGELNQLLMMLASQLPEEAALETPNIFPEWEPNIKFKKDQYITYGTNTAGDPQIYKVLKTVNTSESETPDKSSDYYKAIGLTSSGYPIWIEPTNNKDAYNKGDIVDRNGILYISLKNNNQDDPEDNTGKWEIYVE